MKQQMLTLIVRQNNNLYNIMIKTNSVILQTVKVIIHLAVH